MIDSIRIRNIQSHKETELKLHPGVNVIVGSSNSGKSAILRALYWGIYNRPLGIDTLCSHWALDDKGNINDEMSVEVTKGDSTLVRRKAKGVNQYVIDGKELNAIKTEVPPEVNDFFKLTETNVQRQQDAPFLVSNTSGEVARYFNGIARLDKIDNVLTYAESVKRQGKATIESKEDDLRKQEEVHESFSWIGDAMALLATYDRMMAKLDAVNEDIAKMDASLQEYKNLNDTDATMQCALMAKKEFDEYDRLQKESVDISSNIASLEEQLKRYGELRDVSDIDLDDAKELIDELKSHEDQMTKHVTTYSELDMALQQYEKYNRQDENSQKDIKELKEQLPDICPICGHPMEDCNG